MSSCCDVWVEKCLEICRAREVVGSNFLVGLEIELGGASVDIKAVRSRCRFPTLILIVNGPFWKIRFDVLEPSM